MSEKKARGSRKSDRPAAAVAAELKEKRDAFLHTFFKRGAELTDELVQENRRLREQLAKLEDENAALETQLASDRAIRDLLRKIDQLEQEKARLLSTVHEQEEITGQITNRFARSRRELESFANLYVASFQLHLSLRLRTVVRHVKELLAAARRRAVAAPSTSPTRRGGSSSPIASEGVELGDAAAMSRCATAAPSEPWSTAVIERAFLTGVPHVAEGDVTTAPAACIPLHARGPRRRRHRRLRAPRAEAALRDRRSRALQAARRARRGRLVAAYLYTSGTAACRRPRPSRAPRLIEAAASIICRDELHRLER